MSIALLWDASHLWGLLARQALTGFGVPCHLLKAQNIAQSCRADKFSLLIVPGGSARHKFEALGPQGRAAVKAFVAGGGHYLGFCGGAGLGLDDADMGIGLCPWRRSRMTARLQHQLSGHVRVRFEDTDQYSRTLLPDDLSEAEIPVWWPGRFEEPAEHAGVHVLARYAGAGEDLHVADLALSRLPGPVLNDWQENYGIRLMPAVAGSPCVIHGRFGRGTYTLSYSHLETPASGRANVWMAKLLRQLGNVMPCCERLPAWYPAIGVCWTDPVLLSCRDGMLELLALGCEQGLLFPRLPWLVGWRAGVPGVGLNTLALAFCMLAAHAPRPEAEERWNKIRSDVAATFDKFRRGAESCLLAQRLAATVPEAVPEEELSARRLAMFGTPMQGGGLCQELLDLLDGPLFAQLQEQDD